MDSEALKTAADQKLREATPVDTATLSDLDRILAVLMMTLDTLQFLTSAIVQKANANKDSRIITPRA